MIGLIINPKSGNGHGAKIWREVEQYLQANQMAYVYRVTSKPLEATWLAQEILREYVLTCVIAIGGDGTLHEVALGLWQAAQQGHVSRLGLIPAGTGNDFARVHHIPREPLVALALCLDAKHEKRIDIILDSKKQHAIAVNSVGVGFDGWVSKLSSQSKSKRWFNRVGLGALSYFIIMFIAFWTYRPTKVWVTIDGQESSFEDAWFVVVTNAAYFGGGMMICPHASAVDGWLDVVIVTGKSRLRLLPLMGLVYRGQHIGKKAVHVLRGQQIHVRAQADLLAQADGEAVPGTPLAVKVAPAALPICAGATG